LKTTDHFHGCKIRVASYGIPPSIISTGNSTDSDGNVVYKLGGLAVHNLRLAVDKINVTVVFLRPSLRLTMVEATYAAVNLAGRRSDIVIVPIAILDPLLPMIVSTWFEPTIPYEYTAVKWSFLCPQPVDRMEKVMHTYTLHTLPFFTCIYRLHIAIHCFLNQLNGNNVNK
jgi:hypothetical protein